MQALNCCSMYRRHNRRQISWKSHLQTTQIHWEVPGKDVCRPLEQNLLHSYITSLSLWKEGLTPEKWEIFSLFLQLLFLLPLRLPVKHKNPLLCACGYSSLCWSSETQWSYIHGYSFTCDMYKYAQRQPYMKVAKQYPWTQNCACVGTLKLHHKVATNVEWWVNKNFDHPDLHRAAYTAN